MEDSAMTFWIFLEFRWVWDFLRELHCFNETRMGDRTKSWMLIEYERKILERMKSRKVAVVESEKILPSPIHRKLQDWRLRKTKNYKIEGWENATNRFVFFFKQSVTFSFRCIRKLYLFCFCRWLQNHTRTTFFFRSSLSAMAEIRSPLGRGCCLKGNLASKIIFL